MLLPKDTPSGQIVDELRPDPKDIVMMKTTDSALTGTNLRLILSNMGIKNVICTGIFTDQCVSSTVRSLVDESFNVVVVEDCCAAATDELHRHELEIINMIYCHVVNLNEVIKCPHKPPAIPAKNALAIIANHLKYIIFAPIDSAAISLSRVALSKSPKRESL